MPRLDLDRKMAALALIGKTVRFKGSTGDVPLRITGCSWNGMLSVDGWAVEFEPDVFEVVDGDG